MTDDRSSADARHPIGVVARRTGISLHVLRAWERRYGLVSPVRTAGGQRLYSDGDIVRLKLLRQATEAGRPIGAVADVPTDELVALVGGDAPPPPAPGGNGALDESLRAVRGACMEAARSLDGPRLRALLMRSVVQLNPADFVDRVIAPLLEQVGDEWHRGALSPAHEHLVSVTVRHVLAWTLDTFEASREAPVLIVTTVAGETHELGAMLAAVVAAEEGWRALYLGPSLPAGDIAKTVDATGALGVAVSIVYPDDEIAAKVGELRSALPSDRLLLAGGRGAVATRSALEAEGASVVADMPALREVLRTVHGTRSD
jgi:methylmalonyl-CoA mutase cobalamin-binding subunit